MTRATRLQNVERTLHVPGARARADGAKVSHANWLAIAFALPLSNVSPPVHVRRAARQSLIKYPCQVHL